MTDTTKTPDTSAQVEKDARKIMAERKAARDAQAAKETPSDPITPPAPKADKASQKTNWSLRLLLLLIVFLLGAGTGLYFLPQISDRLPIVADWVGKAPETTDMISQLDRKITALESRLEQQDANLRSLSTVQDTQGQQLSQLVDQSSSLPAADNPAIPEIVTRLDSLEQARLKDTTKTEDQAQAARIDMLLGRMSQLEASFVPLSKGLADAQTAREERRQLTTAYQTQAETLAQIAERLQQVEDFAARDTSGALLAFRIGALQEKVSSGKVFDREIAAVNALTQKGSFAFNGDLSDNLSWLSQHESGVATAAELEDRFQALIPTLMRAAATHADDPWWTRAYNSVKNLVLVRKTMPDETGSFQGSLDGVISDVSQMLARHDVSAAAERLDQLPENFRATLATWMSDARVHIRAAQALDRIESLTAGYYLSSPAAPVQQPSVEDAAPEEGQS